LFENPEYFHLGADEAFLLGTCEKCLKHAEQTSRSNLYISHIKKLYEPLLKKGIKPIIWADMILKYNESLNELSRDVYLCDWNYYNSHKFKKIWVWGKGFVEINDLPKKTIDKFGDFIFPDKDRSKVNYYYTTDFLLKNGFKVLCAPSSSCYNDTHGAIGECVFAPHEEIHPVNCFDFSKKGIHDAEGVLLTSWSVHLHPWEMQINSIYAPGYVAKENTADFNAYEAWFLKNIFGDNAEEYLSLTRLFNPACIFSYGTNIKFGLGYGKSAKEVPLGWVNEKLKIIKDKNLIDEFLIETRSKLEDYKKALKGFKRLKNNAARNVEYLEYWIFASELMINRAKVVLVLLESCISNVQIDKNAITTLISELEVLRNKYKKLYLTMQKPFRANQITRWVFDSLLHELKSLACTKNKADIAQGD
ncbi:MAG: family 20 glycosylhydrolase, partial [Victivallaceae bacterium]|nr:family 20 glycosylhydrolase [Victivallaceae bacterium]